MKIIKSVVVFQRNCSPPVTTCHLLSYLFIFFKVAYIANNMDPDQTAPSLIRVHIVCFHEKKSSLKCTCRHVYAAFRLSFSGQIKG